MIFQCVPNFSEGRRTEVVEAIAQAIRETNADLRDYSADPDHNRCVMTLLGDENAIFHGMMMAAEVALSEIDLRTQSGVHPRVGAIDVVPVVPLRGATKGDAIRLADRIARALSETFGLNVYFYEDSAQPGRVDSLPQWRNTLYTGTAIAPDYGTGEINPKHGSVIVGARSPLVAYNVNLKTEDVTVAHAIARKIRQERDTNPILDGVRALGLFLDSQKRAQVSFNLTNPRRTPLPAVFDFIKMAAQDLDAEIEESEIIGVIPYYSLGKGTPDRILWRTYKPSQILSAEEIRESK